MVTKQTDNIPLSGAATDVYREIMRDIRGDEFFLFLPMMFPADDFIAMYLMGVL